MGRLVKRWVVKREELTSSPEYEAAVDVENVNKRLTQWLREGWEPFAAQHSDQLHHHTQSWVWLRKEIEED